jgi:hypothetical protein
MERRFPAYWNGAFQPTGTALSSLLERRFPAYWNGAFQPTGTALSSP